MPKQTTEQKRYKVKPNKEEWLIVGLYLIFITVLLISEISLRHVNFDPHRHIYVMTEDNILFSTCIPKSLQAFVFI